MAEKYVVHKAIPVFFMLVLSVFTFYLLRSWVRSDEHYYNEWCKPECCIPPISSNISCDRGCVC